MRGEIDKRRRGYANWRAGEDAEASVAERYLRNGSRQLAHRWRGRGGEIDLVFGEGPVTVFVEVKRAGDFDTAAGRIGPAQIARIAAAAQEFLEEEPGGQLRDCRFDVALVNGRGETRIIENALAA